MRTPWFSVVLFSISALQAEINAPNSRIAAAMQAMIQAKEIPGAVTLIATRSGVTHLEAIGSADPAGTKPLRKNSLFWIASMTKPMTGTAILMLQEDGKLSVDDLVGKYIPELANLKTPSGKPANLTLKHLMTHTSGLPEATAEEARAAQNLADLIPAYTNKPMQFEPGSKWQYCQSGINTLGRIIEVVSGQAYEKFLARRLFEPLGMKDTTFYVRPEQVARLVTPVKRGEDGALTEPRSVCCKGRLPRRRTAIRRQTEDSSRLRPTMPASLA
jgi:CubicO group peptidase (beta-lactamase class C family)